MFFICKIFRCDKKISLYFFLPFLFFFLQPPFPITSVPPILFSLSRSSLSHLLYSTYSYRHLANPPPSILLFSPHFFPFLPPPPQSTVFPSLPMSPPCLSLSLPSLPPSHSIYLSAYTLHFHSVYSFPPCLSIYSQMCPHPSSSPPQACT